jgi:hypothetical protein
LYSDLVDFYRFSSDSNMAATLPEQGGGIMAEVGYRIVDPNCP